MISITDKRKCCGCTACSNACPRQCIQMVPDEEGFLYPQVDEARCVRCGRCDAVCPMQSPPDSRREAILGYVARDRDAGRRGNCSSGGFVSAALRTLSQRGFHICGAAFEDDFEVAHRFVAPGGDLGVFEGSKYVQSRLGDSFSRVRELLKRGEKVCFVGTGCQIDGLMKFLGAADDRLFTIGLVCHGVPSPLIWRRYIELQERDFGAKLCSANFRDKSLGYQTPAISLRFSNGRRYLATARVDIMLKSFFTHCALRYSCFNCPGKGLNRACDITVFDCWNSKELIGEDDNSGYTAVIAHTDAGRALAADLNGACELHEIDPQRLIPAGGGGMVMNSAKYTPKREGYYARIERDGLREAFRRTLSVSGKDYALEKVKVLLARAGILKSISRYRRLLGRRPSK